jgi:CARDB
MVARLAVLLSLTLAPVLATAPARGADASSGAPAGARLASCHRAPTIDQRNAVVSTWMRPTADGRRLALKLDLWERRAGQRWALRTDVPGLGSWVTPSDVRVGSRAGDVFKYRQAVGRLEVPAAYRFHVTFHWLDADGKVVREASRTTAVCRQPDLRPDLMLRDVRSHPAGGDSVRYVVRVGNEGESAVVRAVVAATLPGDAAPGGHTRVVRALAPGATAVVRFTGPGCPAGAQPASFVADPSNTVEESDETNNGLAAVCPAP